MTLQALQRRVRSEARAAVLSVLAIWDEPLASKEIAWRAGFGPEATRLALNWLLAEGRVERSKIPGEGTRGCYGWRMADGTKGD